MSEFISVAFKGQWDQSGDKAVLEAVKKIAEQINWLLEGAVNFAATVQGIEKIAAAFDKITKSASNVEAAMRATKKAQGEEEMGIKGLIAAYKLLDEVSTKPRATSAWGAKKEMEDRAKAIKVLRELERKAENEQARSWAGNEISKQLQTIRALNREYKDAVKASDAIANSNDGSRAAMVRYLSEMQKVNRERKQYQDPSFGAEGLNRQIAGYQRMKVVMQEMADASLVSQKKASSVINEMDARIGQITELKRAESKVDRESGESAQRRRQIEMSELNKLKQVHEQLSKSLSSIPEDGSSANVALRTKLEKELQGVILKRIQLGDRNRNELVQEYEQIMRNASGVDRLEQELRVLKAVINSPLQSENLLASMEKRIQTIDEAIAVASKMKKVGGTEGDTGAKEMASLKTQRKGIADQMQIMISDQIKEIDLIKKEEEAVRRLSAEYNKLRKDAATGLADKTHGGMLSSQASLQESMKTVRDLYKAGGIGEDVYQRELAEVRKQLLLVRSELRKYEKELMSSGDTGAKAAKVQVSNVETLEKKYRDLTNTIKEMEAANASPVTLKPKYEALRTLLGQLHKEGIIDTVEYDKRNVEASKTLAKLDAQTKKLHQAWGKSFKDLIKYQMEWYAGTTIILGTMYGLTDAIRKAFDFTQSVRDAKAVIGATEEEFSRMQESVLTIGKNIAVSAQDAAQAIKILGQAGLSAEQSIASLETVAGLIVATGGEMEETVKSVTTVMNVWNYESSRVSEIGNVMAASLNASKLEMKDLGVIFNYLASTAAEVKWSFEETSAAASVLSNQGVRVSTIGTGLSSVISSLIAPTQRMRDVFDEFGITMEDLDPRTHSFADILDVLAEKGFGVEEAFKAFNKREARILASSINAGADAFREMTIRLTGTNAMLKMVDDSMAGAKRQFELLGIEIQNRFNRAMMDGESYVASLAKGMRWLVSGAADAIGPIIALNAALMITSSMATKAAGGVSLLSKAYKGIGGWIGLVAIAGSILIGVISKLYETHEEYYAKLEEGIKKDQIAAEGYRQRVVAMGDFLKMAEKHKTSEQELVKLKDQLILQDPKIIKFLEAQGIAASDTVVDFQALTTAIKEYREEQKELQGKKDQEGLEKEIQSFIVAQNNLMSAREKLNVDLQNAPFEPRFSGMFGDIENEIKKVQKEAMGWEQKMNAFLDSVKNKARSLAKDPEGLEKFKAILIQGFDDAQDQEGLKRALAAVDAGVEAQKKKLAESTKGDVDSWAETNKAIKAAYEERRTFIDETLDYMISKNEHAALSEEEILAQSADLYKQKASMLIALADEEARARIAALDNVHMSTKERETAMSRIQVDASKLKMKAWDDMNQKLKAISQEQMAFIDYQFQASVDNTNSIAELNLARLENTQKTEIQKARQSVRIEKGRTDDIIGLYRGEAERKKSIIEKTFSDEKEKRKEIAKINKDVLDKEADAYEDLKGKMIDAFDSSKARAQKLKEEFKQLGQNIKDSFGMANRALEDIFGKKEMKPNDVLSEVASMQAKVKKLMSQGTEESLNQASEMALKSMEVLKGIDYEKWKNQSGPTLKDEISDAAVEAEELYRKAQKGLQTINQSEQTSEKQLQSKLKGEIDSLQYQLDQVTDKKLKLGIEVDPKEAGRVKDEIEKNVKPKIEIELKGNLSQVEAQMQEVIGQAQEKGAQIPIIPFAKEEDLAALRLKLQEPETKPLGVQASNWPEVQAMIQELQRPITKVLTIIEKHVKAGGGESSGESDGGGESDGYESGGEFATGGWLPGYGGGDRIKILAEAGEFINRKESVNYYSKELFDLLNSRAIPRELLYEALRGQKAQKFAQGGLVEQKGSTETFTLSLNYGNAEYPLSVLLRSRDVFYKFMERLKKEDAMRRKN